MTNGQSPVIVWFRDDLRLADNPALQAAAGTGRPLLCVYVFDEASEGVRPLGAAARWWLHGSLAALEQSLAAQQGRLVIFRGRATELIPRIASACRAAQVHWNRRYGAAERRVDEALKLTLRQAGIEASSASGHLIHEPWTLKTGDGGPFRVFSAFWRAAQKRGAPPTPLPAPAAPDFAPLPAALAPLVVALPELQLEPSRPDWAHGMRQAWQRGEAGALQRLDQFLEEGFGSYAEERDRPDVPVTSRLSPYLRFGNISVREVWHAAVAAAAASSKAGAQRNLDKFLAELGWREFSWHLLYHYPDLAQRNFSPRFDRMPWRTDPVSLAAWQRGRTGYPLVDAGMRELWHTGWMHNRVRMVVASFLTKHLLIDWRHGEAWFWDTLVDADPANNPASWQWVAGSGADAAPYFRVFNPVLQGEKFDPDGRYVKHWLPGLAQLPASLVQRPWDATPAQLAAAGVVPGETCPLRIVEHGPGRQRALEAFGSIGR